MFCMLTLRQKGGRQFMTKVRTLSVLSLVVCLAALYTGLNILNTDVIQNTKGWGLFLAICGAYGTVAAIMVTLLSLFAVQPSEDGSFTIKKKSLYGRVFASVLGYEKSFSLCSAFWTTNALLLLISFIVGAVFAVIGSFVHLGWLGTLEAIGIVLGMILTIGLIALGGIYVSHACDTLSERHPRVTSVASKTAKTLALVLVIVALEFVVYFIGWEGIATSVIFAVVFIVSLVGIVLLVAALCTLVGKVFASQLGMSLSNFYHQNLCPRIKVE